MGRCRDSAHRYLDDHGKHVFITQEHLFKNSNTRLILFCAFFCGHGFRESSLKEAHPLLHDRRSPNSFQQFQAHQYAFHKSCRCLGSSDSLLRPLCARLWRNLAEDVHVMRCEPHIEWISESCGDYEPRRYRVHACYGPRR